MYIVLHVQYDEFHADMNCIQIHLKYILYIDMLSYSNKNLNNNEVTISLFSILHR